MKRHCLTGSTLTAGIAWLLFVSANPALGQDKKPPATIVPGASCVTAECHSALKTTKFLHGPMNLGQCQPCHVPLGNRHQFEKIPEGTKLCQTCHEMAKTKKVVHSPFATSCLLCHNPHGADNRYFVIGGTGVALCDRCHTDVRKDMTYLHGPVALGECVACHSPHQSDYKALLVDSPSKLCVGCHVDMKQSLEGAVSIHKPVQEGCIGCHHPHGGKLKYFLRKDPKDLCASCHGDFLKKMESFKFTHTPMVEGKGCQNCHRPHFSNQQYLLKDVTSKLCFGCHNKDIQTKTRVIPNMKAKIESSKYLHGPVREGNCAACHQAHGSEFWDLLNKSFPKNFYSPYTDNSYDLCFECHDRTIVESKTSTATGFRNGDLNLHYLHVHRDRGRSCRACHDVHGSNQPKHIRASVGFGRWQMKIEYTKTATGGGCATGCHTLYRYDRVHPVLNLKPNGQPVEPTPIVESTPTAGAAPGAKATPGTQSPGATESSSSGDTSSAGKKAVKPK